MNKNVLVVALVDRIKVINTKKGDKMMFVNASDEYGNIDLTIFPNLYQDASNISQGDIILANGNVEKRYDKYQIIVNKIEILYKNEIVGFMVLNRVKDKGYAVLDYLAILPQYRNNKLGTKALQMLLEQEKDNRGIFIEIEKVGLGKDAEENLLRANRKNFYEKLGFKKLNFDLYLFGVVYTPYLFSNIKDNEDMIINEILNIYESISGKERIKQNCKIIKKLRFEEITKNNISVANHRRKKRFIYRVYSLYGRCANWSNRHL